jgi:hypothetical protein
MKMKPMYEERSITTNFRCAKATRDMIVMEPVNRQHFWEKEGARTDIPNINIIPNDEIRKTLGNPQVGDVREMTVNVVIQTGFKIDYDA